MGNEHDHDSEDFEEERERDSGCGDGLKERVKSSRKRAMRSKEPSFEESTPAETCYAMRTEEEFAHVSCAK